MMHAHTVPDWSEDDGKLRQAGADESIPWRAAAEVDEACTRWLRARGLMPAQVIPLFELRAAKNRARYQKFRRP